MVEPGDLSGQTLDQYELREQLGRGGRSAVYRAYQHAERREVAVKVLSGLSGGESDDLERFNAVALAAAGLEHPHIVPVFDSGTQDGLPYIVMRFLTGGTLHERIRVASEQGRALPSLPEITELLAQFASALDYAHHRRVIHGDIKPSNIIFDNHGKPYVTDFGIAALYPDAQDSSIAVMPPEYWRGEPADGTSDQYALAVVIYRLIAGHLPFEGRDREQWMTLHLTELPPELKSTRPDLPDALTLVMNRALEKDPARRFRNCTQFAQAFASAIEGVGGETTRFFEFKLPKRKRAKLAPSQDQRPTVLHLPKMVIPPAPVEPPPTPAAAPLPVTQRNTRRNMRQDTYTDTQRNTRRDTHPDTRWDTRRVLLFAFAAVGLLTIAFVAVLITGGTREPSPPDLTLTAASSTVDSAGMIARTATAAPDATLSASSASVIQSAQTGLNTIRFGLDPDAEFSGVVWSFGDGETSAEVSPVHVYPAPGTYTVRMDAVDSSGTEVVHTAEIAVAEGCVLTPSRESARLFARPLTVRMLSDVGVVSAGEQLFTAESVRGQDGFIWYRVYHGEEPGWVHSTSVDVTDGVCP